VAPPLRASGSNVDGSDTGRRRVAVVTHGFSPTVGGSERYHLFTARALAANVNVEVFTSALNLAPADPGAATGRTERLGALTVHYLRSRRLGTERLVDWRTLWSALRRFGPDLVWGNHPSPTADIGALYAQLSGTPWIATYHADVSTRRLPHRLYLACEMFLLRRAAGVLVTSEKYRRLLVERGFRPERITVVPTGPYIGDGTPPTPHQPDSGGRPEAPFLFVGALDAGHAYKRLDLLLGALAAVAREDPTVRLEVVGGGDRRPEFEDVVKRQGLGEHVRFLGALRDDELAERFAGARALVLPAITAAEGFGTVAVEALHYGCPVVVSDRVPIAGAISTGEAGLVFSAADANALPTALRRLLREPALRAHLAAGAARLARQFEWSSLLPRMTEPARAILRRSARGDRVP
jgi:glycosyltransferase involved in cell wall biosynthesis